MERITEEKEKNMKKERGITLVALVVTIVVLLILAAISINLVLGQNGIISKAQEGKIRTEQEQGREEINLALIDMELEKVREGQDLTLDDIAAEEGKELVSRLVAEGNPIVGEVEGSGEDAVIHVQYRGYLYEINGKKEITILGEAGAYPVIKNVKITREGKTEEVIDGTVENGTQLVISFEHSIEGGTTTVEPSIPYTTDRGVNPITFTITGVVNGKTYTRKKTISVEEKYSAIKVGDFVNYTAGTWTQKEIDSITNAGLYEGTALPTNSYKFGGFGVGSNKDKGITPYGVWKNKYSGWRVLSIKEDGNIDIIHAGTPESYLYASEANTAYKAQYMLGGGIHTDGTSAWNYSSIPVRSWNMYVNTTYATAAHCLNYQEINKVSQSSDLRACGAPYYLASISEGG